MLFDLDTDGHHSIYIQHLVEYWLRNRPMGRLFVVVSPSFVQTFPNIANVPKMSRARFIAVGNDEYDVVRKSQSKIARRYNEWGLINRYARQLNADRCLIMYFDHLQLPFILGRKPPCPVSGIYFRPSFHYNSFPGYATTYASKLRQLIYWHMLVRVLTRPYLKNLFCLDPFGTRYIKKLIPEAKILPLPDPVQIYDSEHSSKERLKASLGVARTRRIFLLFGAITRRKGVYQVLKSLALLPRSVGERLCLMIVGPVKPAETARLLSQIDQLRKTSTVEIILQNGFVSDRCAEPYFQISDVVIALYQNHVGSSNVLLRAAATGRPVLASHFGLIGEMVRTYNLGITVDASAPPEIAKAVIALVEHDPTETFDYVAAKQLAAENSTNRFTHTLFQNL